MGCHCPVPWEHADMHTRKEPMLSIKWVAYGVVILACLAGIGLIVGAVLKSTMYVNDHCKPTGHGFSEVKSKDRFDVKELDTE